jgi:hypothetical protein
MKSKILVLCATAALVAGCETLDRKTTAATVPTPQPAPTVVPVSGTDLDSSNVEKVRLNESLKAYPVGRYVDPKDPNLMHEAHVVYRREAGANWNLNPNAPTAVPLGPVIAVADPAKTPGPLPAELEAKMAEQNQLVASLIEQNEALTKELAKLNQDVAALRQKQSPPKEGER